MFILCLRLLLLTANIIAMHLLLLLRLPGEERDVAEAQERQELLGLQPRLLHLVLVCAIVYVMV